MAYEFHDEPLHLGLVTSRPPAFLEKGELQRARGGTYLPGEFAIFPAEGRLRVRGTSDLPHAGGPISRLGFAEWDDGTNHILYATESSTIRKFVASPDVLSPLVDVGASVGISTGAPQSEPFTVLSTKSEHLILTKKRIERYRFPVSNFPVTFALKENDGGTFSNRKASSRFGLRPLVTQDSFALSFEDVHLSVSNYVGVWFTLYDNVQKREGAATVDSVGVWGFRLDTAFSPVHPLIPGAVAGSNVGYITALVEKQALEAFVADTGASHLRIYAYRIPADAEAGYPGDALYTDFEEALVNAAAMPYPAGANYVERDIATVIADTYVKDPRFVWLLPNVKLRPGFSPTRQGSIQTPGRKALYPAYPLVHTTVGGTRISVSRYTDPPKSSIGIFFRGSLVLRDDESAKRTRYSVPTEYHAFPGTFLIDHDSPENDRIIQYQTDGRVLGVYLRYNVVRVNYLPSSADADFRAGQVQDDVPGLFGFGAVAPRAVTRFAFGGTKSVSAHVADNGIWMTDFFESLLLTLNLDWRSLIGRPEYLSQCFLINNVARERLEFYVSSDGGFPDHFYALHYDPQHIRGDGRPAITGPVPLPGRVAAAIPVKWTDGSRGVVTSDGAGRLFYNGHGVGFDESDGSLIGLDILTREIYPAGLTRKTDLDVFWAHVKPAFPGNSLTVVVTPGPDQGNKGVVVYDNSDLALIDLKRNCERVTANLISGSGGLAVNAVGFLHQPLEGTPPRRTVVP